MKKLLLGAVMSALFVMNADAGLWSKVKQVGSSIKNKTVQLQHKMKGDRTMDEKDIQIYKAYLNKIITTGNALLKIMDPLERDSFEKVQNSIKKYIMIDAREIYRKNASYDENEARQCINSVKDLQFWNALKDHVNSQEYVAYNEAVRNTTDYAKQLQKKYPDNAVLDRTVEVFSIIADVVSGEAAARYKENLNRFNAEFPQSNVTTQPMPDLSTSFTEQPNQFNDGVEAEASYNENLNRFNAEFPQSNVTVTQSEPDLSTSPNDDSNGLTRASSEPVVRSSSFRRRR